MKMKKITSVTVITTSIVWFLWTLFVNGTYAFAAICEGGFDNLVLGEELTFVNFVINSMFVVTFGVATLILIRKAKARKSK